MNLRWGWVVAAILVIALVTWSVGWLGVALVVGGYFFGAIQAVTHRNYRG